jgi:hypothetical protein
LIDVSTENFFFGVKLNFISFKSASSSIKAFPYSSRYVSGYYALFCWKLFFSESITDLAESILPCYNSCRAKANSLVLLSIRSVVFFYY